MIKFELTEKEQNIMYRIMENAINIEIGDYLPSLHGDDLKNEIEYTETLIGIFNKICPENGYEQEYQDEINKYKGEKKNG